MKELEVFYSFIAAYIDLDDKLKLRIGEIIRFRHYAANSHILNEGQHSKYFRFLVSGAVRFHANYDGRDVTTWLELEKQILFYTDGFSFKTKNNESILALEDCLVIEISSVDFKILLAEFPNMEHFMRLWIEDEMSAQLEFYKFFIFMTAKQKYDRLLSYVPNIELRIKAIYIASFLGISPETLSRLRAAYLK
jgi:CRP-like cAMP-binding protein